MMIIKGSNITIKDYSNIRLFFILLIIVIVDNSGTGGYSVIINSFF